MGKVIGRLQQVFRGHDGAAIWNAVDTVERFQGQQRGWWIVHSTSFRARDPLDVIRPSLRGTNSMQVTWREEDS